MILHDAFFERLLRATGIEEGLTPLPEDVVSVALASEYGLTGELRRIDTEKDDTFKLSSNRGPLLVKVAPAAETRELVDLQSAALTHTASRAPDVPVQRIVRGVRDQAEAIVTDPAGNQRIMRVLSYIEGPLLHQVTASPAQLGMTGAMLARLDDALADFRHPCDSRLLLWDLTHFSRLRHLIDYVVEDVDRELAHRVFDDFDAKVEHRIPALEKQFIHGDYSPFNIVVDPNSRQFVTGVIDFGDAVRAPVVFDLSVAAANQIGVDAHDPWASATEIIRGYREVRALAQDTVDLIEYTAPARLLLRALIYGWRSEHDPASREYARSHAGLDWERLHTALAVDSADVRAKLASTEPPIRSSGKDCMSAPRAPKVASPSMVNAFDAARLGSLPKRAQDQVSQRARLLGPGYRLFYEEPVEIVRGAGTTLFDADGNEYLDAYNNVASVGHGNKHVVESVYRQLQTLNTNTRYLQQSILDYSEQLLATMPDALGNVMFTCTGSEANDLAVRVANYFTGQQGIIVTSNAYHGLTANVAAFSPSLGEAVPLAPFVRTISPPDAMRIGSDVGEHLRAEVRSAIADLERHGYGLSVFVADQIFSSDGVFADPAGFLGPVLEEVHAAGGLYLADEVQPGFGRTGDAWWGFQRHGIVPDIVTMGKPMGNGTPVAAAVFRPELLVEFGRNVRYFNTYGGNSVAIAAAQATLDVIKTADLIGNAQRVGQYLMSEIDMFAREYEQVAEVRGAGLFIAVDVVTDAQSKTPDGAAGLRLVNEMRRRRVLISASGPLGHALKIRPPLVFSTSDADRLLESLAASFAAELH